MIKAGDSLTINCDIINISGQIILKTGQKVMIREVNKTLAKWSNYFNIYLPEKMNWVKLKGIYGIWSLSIFREQELLLN